MDAEGREELYTVSIKGSGVAVERTVPAQVARQVLLVVMGGVGSDRLAPIKDVEHPNLLASGGRKTSLREFLEGAQAQRNPDKITAIAEYLFQFEQVELFTKDDIKGRFRLAGEAPPGNFARDFTWAVKNGWVAEDVKSPGSFYVTQKGRTAIESKFSDDVRKATTQPTGRRRSRKNVGDAIQAG